MMRIACLHTAESNIAIFETAANQIKLPADALSHHVRADLLQAAEHAGGLTPDIAKATASALRLLGQNADAVILTCSTLGPSVHGLEHDMAVPALRVDATLARQAIDIGGMIVVLCAVETTLAPTSRLFTEMADPMRASCDVRLVPKAWDLFKNGNRADYLTAIADAAEDAYRGGATIVALAQASMAGAADLVQNGPKPLSSPTAGLTTAVNAILKER